MKRRNLNTHSGRTNKLFMAWAKGSDNNTTSSFKRYIGYAPVNILAINPSRNELEKIYNTKMDTDPIYIKEIEVGQDKHKVKQLRIDFIVKTDPSKCIDASGNPIEAVTRVTFFINDEYMFNTDKTKMQVIDEYGRTAWVTQEEFKAKAIPVYSNGPANISSNYKAARRGEEQLVEFCRCYLGIPRINWYDRETSTMKTNEHPENCVCSFDHMENFFKGDLSELKNVIGFQPKNSVYVLFGIRTTPDNKQYQTVFTEQFLSGRAQSFTAFQRRLDERKSAGAYSNTEFEVCPLKEYIVKPTPIPAAVPDDDLPFGDAPAASPWDN